MPPPAFACVAAVISGLLSLPSPASAVESTAPPAPAASSKASSTEKIRVTLLAYVAAWNAHDPKAIAEVYAPDAIRQSWGGCNQNKRQALIAEAQSTLTMFPDLSTSLRRVFVKGNQAVIEVVLSGTNTGPSPAPERAPPTGNAFGEVGARIMTFTPEGLIRDERDYFDAVTQRAQLHGRKEGVRSPSVANVPVEVFEARATPGEAKNVATTVAMQEAYGAHDARRYGDALAEGVLWDDFMAPAALLGRAPQVDYFRLVTKALPDVISNCDTWAAGDYVVEECSIVGTDTGRIDAVHKPTGDRIAFHRLDLLEMRDGKVAKAWSYGNRDEKSRDLGGVFPARGEKTWALVR